MNTTALDLEVFIAGAIQEAWATAPDAQTHAEGAENSRRAKSFVRGLAHRFRQLYSSSPFPEDLYRTLARGYRYSGNTRCELLYDIVVCAVAQRGRMACPVRAEWLIESEMATRTTPVLDDFGKLLIGGAPYRLFIGSRDWRELLGPVARHAKCCRLFLAEIEHPSRWYGSLPDPVRINIWEFASGANSWVPVGRPIEVVQDA